MKLLLVLVSLFQSVFSSFGNLTTGLVMPAVQVVGEIREIVKKLRGDKNASIEMVFGNIEESLKDRFLATLPVIIRAWKIIKVNEASTDQEVLEKTFKYLAGLEKPVADALLFKLCSQTVQKICAGFGIELKTSEADTFTQLVFAKVKTNWAA